MTATTASPPGGPRSAGDISACPYDYRIKPRVLKEKYQGVAESSFGSVRISLPDGRSYVVRDLHYRQDDGRLGMQFVPVNDHGQIGRPGGGHAPGSWLIDNLLRARMGLRERDPIYAIAAYIRPEEHVLTLAQLPLSKKLFHAYKHLAAYVGDGKTTHSPEKHHTEAWRQRGHNVWRVAGYPATVFFISLDGVDQLTLNRNARIVDAVLNAGALSPANFERMRCRVFTLNTALQFYRDWVRKAEYLADPSWHMSCGDHKAVVINVMLNVPHNKQSFREIFGDDGSQLWVDFLRRFREVCGRGFRRDDETRFQPLWQKAGVTAQRVQPLSMFQQDAFDAALLENRLDTFDGLRPLKPGVGMAWPMETIVDLLYDFVSTYLRFSDVGGVVGSALLARLAVQAPPRLGISEDRFCEMIAPLASKMILADALMNAPKDADWLKQARQSFGQFLLDDSAESADDYWSIASVQKLVNEWFEETTRTMPRLVQGKAISTREALAWLQPRLSQIMEDLRGKATSGLFATRFFASPSVFHRIALGTYPHSPFVRVTPVCTVLDHTEVEFGKTGSPASTCELCGADQRPPIERRPSFTTVPLDTDSANSSLVLARAWKAGAGERALVFAVGQLGYDFGSEANLDSFKQRMSSVKQTDKNPLNERQLLKLLKDRPWYAASLLWTLKRNDTPYYIVQPDGAFAQDCYRLLVGMLRDESHDLPELIVVPGSISGPVTLMNGQELPAINPDLRSLRGWRGPELAALAKPTPPASHGRTQRSLSLQHFLDRIHHELLNAGRTSRDRALNYGAMYLADHPLIPAELYEQNSLDTITVKKRETRRAGSDCWDVTVSFLNPNKPVPLVRHIYQCTVDVSEIIPVTVGDVRFWTARIKHG